MTSYALTSNGQDRHSVKRSLVSQLSPLSLPPRRHLPCQPIPWRQAAFESSLTFISSSLPSPLNLIATMASGELATGISPSMCTLLASPLEIRIRIYRHYFRNPVISVWNPRRASTLGHPRSYERGNREITYRRAVADDLDDDQYERKRESELVYPHGHQTVGWLHDHSSIFLTCRQIQDEAKDVLGSLLHVKMLYSDETLTTPQAAYVVCTTDWFDSSP